MEIAILLMVLVASALFILAPLFSSEERSTAPARPQHRAMAEALSRRDATYQALADLEEDLAAGKLSDADHAALKKAYEQDAIRALRDLESLDAKADTEGSA